MRVTVSTRPSNLVIIPSAYETHTFDFEYPNNEKLCITVFTINFQLLLISTITGNIELDLCDKPYRSARDAPYYKTDHALSSSIQTRLFFVLLDLFRHK